MIVRFAVPGVLYADEPTTICVPDVVIPVAPVTIIVPIHAGGSTVQVESTVPAGTGSAHGPLAGHDTEVDAGLLG